MRTNFRARLRWRRAVIVYHLLNDGVYPWNWRVVQRLAERLSR